MNVGKTIKGMLIGAGLAGLASNGLAAYNATYATSDLGTAIIDLLVSIVVSVAGQGNTIGQLIVVMLVVSLIGGVFTVLVGLIGSAVMILNRFKGGI
jgi:hypothetical protein